MPRAKAPTKAAAPAKPKAVEAEAPAEKARPVSPGRLSIQMRTEQEQARMNR